ncbi:MAG: phosphoadenosine phosphosulfate reductase family protein [Provencibacterium sp.]|nr:phosphoadenosine phosphosulfate reductase family protein [Provencibacterium sp.]
MNLPVHSRHRLPDGGGFFIPPKLHVLSLSGGKDSTALTLLMVEKGLPIDMVITADTGMEFPEMREHLAKLDSFLYRERGLHITTLRHPHGFEWLMFDTPLKQERATQRRMAMGQPLTGYGWPGLRTCWCTSRLKTDLIEREVNRQKKGREPVKYIGIAADETKRCKVGQHIRYPLAEWGITEAEALRICYGRGFDFGGLYETYRRASCWCCPFQRIGELRKLRAHHPELWERLRMMDSRAREQFGPGPLGQFKPDWNVQRLEERFAREEG